MHIPAKRRRRALRAHYLQQRGHAQRQIAEQLDISPATVRADLQLLESHWSQIAAAAADDLLLESLHLLQIRLTIAIQHDELTNYADRLAPAEYLSVREAQESRLTALAREIRRTAHEVHQRAEQRPDQPGHDEPEPQEPAETTPKLSQTTRPDSTISSPEQEILPADAAREQTPSATAHPPPADPHEALIDEAVRHFPQLEGQSEQHILTFLDQLTNPRSPIPDNPPPIHAAAAG